MNDNTVENLFLGGTAFDLFGFCNLNFNITLTLNGQKLVSCISF